MEKIMVLYRKLRNFDLLWKKLRYYGKNYGTKVNYSKLQLTIVKYSLLQYFFVMDYCMPPDAACLQRIQQRSIHCCKHAAYMMHVCIIHFTQQIRFDVSSLQIFTCPYIEGFSQTCCKHYCQFPANIAVSFLQMLTYFHKEGFLQSCSKLAANK